MWTADNEKVNAKTRKALTSNKMKARNGSDKSRYFLPDENNELLRQCLRFTNYERVPQPPPPILHVISWFMKE